MHSMEVLAPVGGKEQLLAAVRCGADAVYLGAKGFNARRNAENFEETGLTEAVSYCHARNVRVHVTVNTLVTDDELPALLDTLREVTQSGADAVIVQDLAVASLVRQHCPDIAMHASTQMTIHNAAGARQLLALGFTRAVLARELSLAEIRAIHEAVPIELEAFVHGALCMSVSGACYLSAMIGGRSGNRGLCAQPCRLDFRAGNRAYALSLKDLSALGHIDALTAAGICSLKIEGRMKRPEYVAAAVTACRKALAGEPYDAETLEAVFSRGGFTDGYLTGRRSLAMFGTRGHEDVKASQRVQGSLASLYRRELANVPVDMVLTLAPNAPATLSVTDGTNSITVRGEIPQQAHTAPTDETNARRSLTKTGESPFALRTLSVHADGALMLPMAALNALRRDALTALLAAREAPKPTVFVEAPLPVIAPHNASAAPGLHLRFESAAQLWDGLTAERVILPMETITPALLERFGDKLVAEIPALFFPLEEERLLATLTMLAAQGLRGVLCHNLGAIALGKAAGLSLHGGYGLNILNSLSLLEYVNMGLIDTTVSFELHARKIAQLCAETPRGILGYGLLPLMQLRACPAQGTEGCDACQGHPVLTDRTGATFPLLCHHRRYSTLLNSVPLNLSGETVGGVDFMTLFFTNETAAECRRILDDFRAGTPPEGHRTRGLYHRTLQ